MIQPRHSKQSSSMLSTRQELNLRHALGPKYIVMIVLHFIVRFVCCLAVSPSFMLLTATHAATLSCDVARHKA